MFVGLFAMSSFQGEKTIEHTLAGTLHLKDKWMDGWID